MTTPKPGARPHTLPAPTVEVRFVDAKTGTPLPALSAKQRAALTRAVGETCARIWGPPSTWAPRTSDVSPLTQAALELSARRDQVEAKLPRGKRRSAKPSPRS